MSISRHDPNVFSITQHPLATRVKAKQIYASELFSLPQQSLCQKLLSYQELTENDFKDYYRDQMTPYNQSIPRLYPEHLPRQLISILKGDISSSVSQLVSEGKAKLAKQTAKIYFGEILNKRREGHGIAIDQEGRIYQGTWVNNEKAGKGGVEVYPNGNLYLGHFDKGKKHGLGTFLWFNISNGKAVEAYTGEWWGGLPDGQGRHTKTNGDVFKGHFKNGLRHGEGSEVYANGETYTGMFVNGLPEGHGVYTCPDGSRYQGQFKQGLKHGKGYWQLHQDATQSYEGFYKDGLKEGQGKYVWDHGCYYFGQFKADERHGYGQYFENNVLQFEGQWLKGVRKQLQQPKIVQFKSNESKNSSIKSNEFKFSEVKYNLPNYSESNYSEPKYNELKYNETKYNETKYNAPKYNETKYNETKYNQPKYIQHRQQKYSQGKISHLPVQQIIDAKTIEDEQDSLVMDYDPNFQQDDNLALQSSIENSLPRPPTAQWNRTTRPVGMPLNHIHLFSNLAKSLTRARISTEPSEATHLQLQKKTKSKSIKQLKRPSRIKTQPNTQAFTAYLYQAASKPCSPTKRLCQRKNCGCNMIKTVSNGFNMRPLTSKATILNRMNVKTQKKGII